MIKKTINIPDLGEAEDVEVIEVCAKAGDQVNPEDPIIVLESDKAAMEIPASVMGKVIAIKVSLGDVVSSDMPFLEIEISHEAEQLTEENTLDQHAEENKNVLEKLEVNPSKPNPWEV